MTKQYKVGDKVLIAATVLEVDERDPDQPIRVSDNTWPFIDDVFDSQPWFTLSRAAAVIEDAAANDKISSTWAGLAHECRIVADLIETESRTPTLREAAVALDAYWLRSFPEGPEKADALTNETKKIWRDIRAAIAADADNS